MYKVEFMDGTKQSLSANYIAENVFAQVDQDGNPQVLLDEIIDYRTTSKEVKQQDAFITTRTGSKRRRETTIGWELLVQWKDGSMNWIALKDLKESYPVQVTEYSVGARISMEPAFVWWVPYMLKKCNRIVAKVKSKYWIRTHKFGVWIPKSVQEAEELDHQNGNSLWWEAICKEMKMLDRPLRFGKRTSHRYYPVTNRSNVIWCLMSKWGRTSTVRPDLWRPAIQQRLL